MHALNNTFQEKIFTKEYLDDICLSLAPDNTWVNPHRSMLGLGNYDVNVIMAALQNKMNCEAVWFDKRKDPECIHTENIVGFILNIPNKYDFGLISLPLLGRRHWIAIRKVEENYWNLDSKLKKPQSLGDETQTIQYIRNQLKENDKELFIVVKKDITESESWLKKIDNNDKLIQTDK